MKIKRIDPVSFASTYAVVLAGIGLCIGAVFALVSLVGGSMIPKGEASGIPMGGAIFGVGAIIALPIMYGIFGFIGGLIGAIVYNIAAKFTGGVAIDTE